MPSAYARFANQRRGYGCSYTLELGSQPGVATITAPPDFGRGNADIATVGPLDLYFERTHLRLRDCRLVNPSSPTSTTATPIVQWIIHDRRWKWQFGEPLDGDYNAERKDSVNNNAVGTLIREKSPRELATLIFTALGEENPDVSALPDKPRPRRVWHAADPRDELDRLCAELGCAPAYDPWDDKAYVVKLGKGTRPPNIAHKSRTDSSIVPPSPEAVEVIGGRTLYQTALKLGEPLALEVDGSYVPADRVSYKPPDGWGKRHPKQPVSDASRYTDPATGRQLYHRDLAERSVYRCYRITGQARGGFSPDALKGTPSEPKAFTDLGPFTGSTLERDLATNARLPAWARGQFLWAEWRDNDNCPPGTRWPGSLTIDSDLRIVTFSDPVYTFDKVTGATGFARDMELIAAYEVTREGVPTRYSRRRRIVTRGAAGTQSEHHPEIVREIVEQSASLQGKAKDNLKECDKQADYYIDSLLSLYQERPATTVTYSGIERFKLDGALRSVTWAFSVASVPETTVSWNCERKNFILPWEERAESRSRRQQEALGRRLAAAAWRAVSRVRTWLAGRLGG